MGKGGVTNVWNRNSSSRSVVSDSAHGMAASNMPGQTGTATATADSAGKGRSVPGQQHAGGLSSNLTSSQW
jgi:hypothetical protein